MIAKIFRIIATFLIRIGGIIFAILSLWLLYYSLYFCKNLLDVLSVNTKQLELDGLRLLGLFIMNLVGLIFDWCIAAIIFFIAISMIVYKTKMADKIEESIL